MPRDPRTGRFPKRPEAVAGGAGWGGAAKGAGTTRRFTSTDQPTGEAKSQGWARMSERSERMKDVLESIAVDAAQPAAARVAAADKLIDRIEGKAPQTNLNLGADDIASLSDADLAAELARVERAAAAFAARGAEKGGSGKPN